jgi:hypothetical protein
MHIKSGTEFHDTADESACTLYIKASAATKKIC